MVANSRSVRCLSLLRTQRNRIEIHRHVGGMSVEEKLVKKVVKNAPPGFRSAMTSVSGSEMGIRKAVTVYKGLKKQSGRQEVLFFEGQNLRRVSAPQMM